jgi:hypothetical protein
VKSASKNFPVASKAVPAVELRKKNLTLRELDQRAFPEHEVSLGVLRQFAYGQRIAKETVQHVEGCEHCQRELSLLRRIDPVLNGEDDRLLSVVVEAAQNPATKQRVAASAAGAIGSLRGAYGKGVVATAAAVVGAVFEAASSATLSKKALEPRETAKQGEPRSLEQARR